MGLGLEEEEKEKWEEEVEGEGGVGGQENELFAHTINLIIKKLKESNRRVIDHLISSRSVYSFDFGSRRAMVQLDGEIWVKYHTICNY